jgi:tripartite-type tricarboxylate transporter receptor subunit TctC
LALSLLWRPAISLGAGAARIGAPRNTPTDIVAKINREMSAGLADLKLKARFAELGGLPMPMTPAEFGTHIATETEKWAKVIRAANIKAE